MVNYQNGKVYKIINENNEVIYIGSTAEKYLSSRYAKHKLKAPNHKIILIENYSCNSREELIKREQEIIEEHSNLLNKYRAYISEEQLKEYNKEYYKNNIKYFEEYNKEYCEKNKEQLKEYKKEYYENNKEHLKNHNKEYRENNKEYIKQYQKEYQKEYRENNKEELKQKRIKKHKKT